MRFRLDVRQIKCYKSVVILLPLDVVNEDGYVQFVPLLIHLDEFCRSDHQLCPAPEVALAVTESFQALDISVTWRSSKLYNLISVKLE